MVNGYEAGLSRDAASFASFLENLAVPEADRWDCEELAEDVATIRSTQAPASHPGTLRVQEAPVTSPNPEAQGTSGKDQRKSASVTIRMTQAECDQLQERAAAAGMTVSAYLRLCVFEAEALRAQVKEALAQFNAASATAERKGPAREGDSCEVFRGDLPSETPRRNFRERIFGRLVRHREAVPA